jgi:hypothetical protein
MVDCQSSHIIGGNGQQHDQHISGFPPCVKNEAGKQKEIISQSSADDQVDKKSHRQKQEEKYD